ncbi:sterol desaturase family protein [Nocardia sp. NPDC020380]|uniref:sterol desaturase family protein n=1 Tax=Nocardia sp. NPDC020380 TaxID=3364309 RepID=UPI0037B90F97
MDNQYLLVISVPALLLLMVIEMVYYRLHPDERTGGYSARDTAASLAVGIGGSLTDVAYKTVALLMFVGIYELSPFRVHVTWLTFPLILIAQDFLYYWMHREHHLVRVLWAAHVVHHSSLKFNFSTSARQPWTGLTSQFFYIPLAFAGVPAWTIFLCSSVIMLSQFWIHTERFPRLPDRIEHVINTPSNHRVHHASQGDYLDRNFGGIFMIWDRVFGTYAHETGRPIYGLTKNIDTFNPLRIATHEYGAIARDMKLAAGWRQRLGVLVNRPGWFEEQRARAAGAGANRSAQNSLS